MTVQTKAIWLTWEDHRRSRELSGVFGAEYVPLMVNKSRFIRYPWLSVLTLWQLLLKRPSLVFCQNPSIVLAFFLSLVKPIFRFTLVVDRHSNFKFEYQNSRNPKWRIFWFLSRATIRFADFTIVTNEPLKVFCESLGGVCVVLPDKLPDMEVRELTNSQMIEDSTKLNVMAVTTFDSDEPIDEILESASELGGEFQFFFTGKYYEYLDSKGRGYEVPENVRFTGFISESDYRVLMDEVDIVLVLTTKELILNCGAYEAVSANKPLVLSNTETLRSYFFRGAVFVDLDPRSIAHGIREAASRREYLKLESSALKRLLEISWRKRFDKAVNIIYREFVD